MAHPVRHSETRGQTGRFLLHDLRTTLATGSSPSPIRPRNPKEAARRGSATFGTFRDCDVAAGVERLGFCFVPLFHADRRGIQGAVAKDFPDWLTETPAHSHFVTS
jgi:hypothetical protein